MLKTQSMLFNVTWATQSFSLEGINITFWSKRWVGGIQKIACTCNIMGGINNSTHLNEKKVGKKLFPTFMSFRQLFELYGYKLFVSLYRAVAVVAPAFKPLRGEVDSTWMPQLGWCEKYFVFQPRTFAAT